MGCDIHFHTEVKIAGRWEHYGHPYVERNYRLFAVLADVRNEDGEFKPIAKPRGLPEDVSVVTRYAYGYPEPCLDWHSASWLGAADIVRFEDAWVKLQGPTWGKDCLDTEHHLFGYLEGSSWAGFSKYLQDRPKHIEDVRWVFWFDN